MVNSVQGDNSEAAGEKKEELVLPVFDPELAPNVRAGFDSTCALILQSHKALSAQIAQLATRVDALCDVPARAPVQPSPTAQPRDVVQRRPVADGDLEDDANYVPQQRPLVGAPRHAARVPLDDGGLGRIKLSIPPFSGDRGPEDYLEWEMRMDQIDRKSVV